MTASLFPSLLESELVWKLSWTLLHSLWQILLIGLLVGTVLSLMSRCSPQLRYVVAVGGLVTMYLPLWITFSLTPQRPEKLSQAAPVIETDLRSENQAAVGFPDNLPVFEVAATEPQFPTESTPTPLPQPTEEPIAPAASGSETQSPPDRHWATMLVPVDSPWLHCSVMLWVAGVFGLGLWNLGGWCLLRRFKSRGTTPVSEAIQQQLSDLLETLPVRHPVKLLQSVLVEVPMVIGWLRPVILLPASLTSGLSSAQLSAILAHELAHIRRYDYLVNLFQSLTETVLFFHPVVWLLSRRIRIEREFCCDDVAVSACGDKTVFVEALAAVESSRTVPQLALSMSGGLTLARARRVMGVSRKRTARGLVSVFALLLLLGVGAGLTMTLAEEPEKPPVAEESETPPSAEAEPDALVKQEAGTQTERFSLELIYYGESGKPFYNFRLTTEKVKEHADSFTPAVDASQWTPDKLRKIKDWLRDSGFEPANAKVKSGTSFPELPRGYLLRVMNGNQIHQEELAWDLTMLLRLKSLRNVLADVDQQATSSLDRLLGRLSGEERIWMQGQPVNDLASELSAFQTRFESGVPIPLTMKLTNTGEKARDYSHHRVSRNNNELQVYNAYGRPVPYVGGYGQDQALRKTLQAGEATLIETLNLAKVYYLRKPGRYFVLHQSLEGRFSNTVEFVVTPSQREDLTGALLRVPRPHTHLVADPTHVGRVRPGRNYEEVDGFPARFVHTPPEGTLNDISIARLWFTNQKAKPSESESTVLTQGMPESEYRGNVGRWHLYVSTDKRFLKNWPTLVNEVTRAVTTPQVSQQPDAIRQLVERLGKTHGLWINGISPIIELPKDATVPQVLKAALEVYSFNQRKIREYQVLRVSQVHIKDSSDKPFTVVHFSSNLGEKILLMQYAQSGQWWTRVFDPSFSLERKDESNEQTPKPAETKSDPISELQDRLNQSGGRWINGRSPDLKLPLEAAREEVLEAALKQSRFEKGTIQEYQILATRDILIHEPKGWTYTAVHISSDQGEKILLMRFEQAGRWWTRFYDAYGLVRHPPGEQEAQHQELRKLLANSDLVVTGKIVSAPVAVSLEAGVENYICDFQIESVLLGDPRLQNKSLSVNIVRLEMGNEKYEQPVEQGKSGVLFLKLQAKGNLPRYQSTDIKTGLRLATPQLLQQIEQTARSVSLLKNYREADVILSGTIVSQERGSIGQQSGIVTTSCLIQPDQILKGTLNPTRRIRVNLLQYQKGDDSANLKSGTRAIFLLKPLPAVSRDPSQPAAEFVSAVLQNSVLPWNAEYLAGVRSLVQDDSTNAIVTPGSGLQVELKTATPRNIDRPPTFRFLVHNHSQEETRFFPQMFSCAIQVDGKTYKWGQAAAWGGKAIVIPPGKSADAEITLELAREISAKTPVSLKPVEVQVPLWLDFQTGAPLSLEPGVHTLRVALSCLEGRTAFSNPVNFSISEKARNLLPVEAQEVEYSENAVGTVVTPNGAQVAEAAVNLLRASAFEATEKINVKEQWERTSSLPHLRIRFSRPRKILFSGKVGNRSRPLTVTVHELVIPITSDQDPDYLLVRAGDTNQPKLHAFSAYSMESLEELRKVLFPKPE